MQVARPKSNAAIRFQRRNPGSSMIHDTKCEEKVRVLSSPIVALRGIFLWRSSSRASVLLWLTVFLHGRMTRCLFSWGFGRAQVLDEVSA